MPDDRCWQAQPERPQIALNRHYDIQYWMLTFACTRDDLHRAIAKVGRAVDDLRTHFATIR